MQHRREFFTQSGLALAGGCGTFHRGLAREVNRNARRKQVVIIGAGLSGLAAARDLQQNQYDVVVIEARDRIGGRVWTSEKWADAVLDLGASWIHGVEDNPLTALADQAGATRVVTDYDNAITYTTSGRPLSNSERVRLKRIDRDVSRAIQRAQQADDDMSVRQAIAPLLRQADEFSDVRQFVDYLLSSEFEHEYAGSAADLSAFWFDSSQNFDGDDVLLAEGLGSLAEFLARGLNIELGQVVQTIDWTKSPVRVVTEKSEFLADQVIVTLPLGVLQRQRAVFSPALPSAKLHAIRTLRMGVLNKCYLRFEETFWPAKVDRLSYIPANHGEWTQWMSLARTTNKPILMGFNAADHAKKLESWSDQQIVASAMHALKRIFGEAIPSPVDHQITRWAMDPFSWGAYSYNPVGSVPKMRSNLAAPLGNVLFFAGEATEQRYFSTAHGAYLSGLRASKEVRRS